MRYSELLKKAEKNNYEGFELVSTEYDIINKECDKYSNYIMKTDTMTLLQAVTTEIINEIIREIKKIPKEQRYPTSYLWYYQAMVYNEILREKMRNNNIGNSSDISKMTKAYRRLAYFVSNVLEPLAAKEPCTIIKQDGYVVLKYEESFDEQNKRTNKMIELQSLWRQCQYMPSEAVIEVYEKSPYTNLDKITEQRYYMYTNTAPWTMIDDEKMGIYNKETRHLLRVHTSMDAYCTSVYMEPLIRYIRSTQELYPAKLHRYLRENVIMMQEDGFRCIVTAQQWSTEKISHFIEKNYIEPMPLGFSAAKTLPIVVRTKETLYDVSLFTDDDRAVIPMLITNMDDKISDEGKINKIDIFSRPIVKCTVEGQELYIYIPIILSGLHYVDTAYNNIQKDNATIVAISKYMEQLISKYLMQIDGLLDANAHLGEDKQLRLFSKGHPKGDFDCFVIDPRHKHGLLIEYKHSVHFRRNARDAKTFAKNYLEGGGKAPKQIHKLLTLIKEYPRELEKYMKLPDGILSELDIYPLIVSSSMEYDGDYPLEPIEVNGKLIDKVKKISYFELVVATDMVGVKKGTHEQWLNSIYHGHETRTLPRIIEIIDTGEVLEMLETMKTFLYNNFMS